MNYSPAAAAMIPMNALEGGILMNRYRLARYVAEGNFGAVFQSEQMILGVPARKVAVKVSKRTGIDQVMARELFGDVFMLAQAMDDMKDAVARSRLVHVYDAGLTEEGRGYVVMEYIAGGTMADELKKAGNVSVKTVLLWAHQLGEALAGLHELAKPLVHRDLKPDNILIGPDGALRVVDFGLTARLNSMGWVHGKAGTTTYMAPETARGRSLPASDIYSIGLVLFEALTGTLPFEHLAVPVGLPKDQHEEWLFEQKIRMRIPLPSSSNPAVPPGVDALVISCLSLNPDDRIPNGRALLRALDEIDNPTTVPGQAAWEKGQWQSRACNQTAAMETWKKGLAVPGINLEQRIRLMECLAQASEQAGDLAGAVDWLGKIWKEAKPSGVVLARAADRIELLKKIIRLHEALGHAFEAERVRRDLKPYQSNA